MSNAFVNPGFLALQKKIKTIVDEHGADALDEFRVSIQRRMKEDFIGSGVGMLTKSEAGPLVAKLLGKLEFEAAGIVPPACDHPELFNWRGKPLFLVYHPYKIPDEEEMKAFCNQYGLLYEITPKSWYFLGRTIRVVIYDPKRQEEYAKAINAAATL